MSNTRIALVTGASRGLGRSMASHLARAGVGVIGTYNQNRAEADALVAQVGGHGVPAAALQLDVSDSGSFPQFASDVRSVLDGFGTDHFDYLVNNAGFGLHAPFTATTPEQFDGLFDVHVKAPFFLTQALLPLLADGGRILNVSSGLARFTYPGNAAYAAAKGAVEVLTRYQAAELGDRRIRVNVLVPGAIATDFGGGLVRDNKQVNEAVAGAIPLGRAGEPDDIGAAVPLILADGFAWANGTRIELSGGQNL
ncbi:short-chain dehydrogenase [Parafrankia colletiae]|uniref:Short-chain dehydrogenase n=1 Tax=Parafrankia colletiae TaxID=573497 RepID=A0A1S1RHU5_9ACTN|nr:SDR family oxidoreductase [Parafrankia colletiae]MCK9899334.1 SDR family oxidoreductase [Frankia sp. Cpl3]OHV44955.1 short-chain dehydrogenase [Parafrankia colletiae]